MRHEIKLTLKKKKNSNKKHQPNKMRVEEFEQGVQINDDHSEERLEGQN